jgi:AcrR family transcriptional regulator
MLLDLNGVKIERRIGSVKAAYHHGDLRAALLTEALDRVRSQGADVVSLRGVAHAVGVSPSAAYHHFPDKDALLGAAAEQAMAELDRRMAQAWDDAAGDDDGAAVGRLQGLGRAYVRFALEEPHLFRHAFGAHADRHGLHTSEDLEAKRADSLAYRLLCQALDDVDAHGLLPPGVREGLDLVTWTTVHGFACLVLEGYLAPEAGEQVLATFSRVALGGRTP